MMLLLFLQVPLYISDFRQLISLPRACQAKQQQSCSTCIENIYVLVECFNSIWGIFQTHLLIVICFNNQIMVNNSLCQTSQCCLFTPCWPLNLWHAGHLEMVKFLLEAGADHEHKTDEMHTALMEASMDGHVEVARLLLDHGAQVWFTSLSPLTLAFTPSKCLVVDSHFHV